MKYTINKKIKFILGTIIVLLSIIVNYSPSMADTLSPFGNFEWSDNIIDVFQKLKNIPSVTVITFSGIDNLENKNANQIQMSNSELVSSIKTTIKEKSKGWMFDEYNHPLILKNGKKSLYFSRAVRISAGPINLVGIPYKVVFDFVAVPGYGKNEEQAIKTDVDGKEIMFIHQFSKMTFEVMDYALARANHQELFNILHKKYPGMTKTFGELWDGKEDHNDHAAVKDGDYTIRVDLAKEEPNIYYTNSFRSVNESYAKYSISIITKELKSEDSSSGL